MAPTTYQQLPELLTLSQACEILNCHPNTLRNWERCGRINCVRFGGRGDRRFLKSDILGLLGKVSVIRVEASAPSGSITSKKIFQQGDCTLHLQDSIQLLRAQRDESVDLIVTDPAYSGMNRHLQLGRGRIVGDYQKDITSRWFAEFEDTEENYLEFLSECWRVMKPDRHIYIMFDSYSLLSLGQIVRRVFDVKNILVWDKVAIGMGHYFRRRHEFIIFASKGKRRLSSRALPDVWNVRRVRKALYPTQKPVELFERMITASAEPGFVVCDPFFGSGSSAVASSRRSCKFIGSDISGKALTFASKRLKEFLLTGVDPAEAPLRNSSKVV